MELTAEQIEKVQKSLKWVVNQIPENLGDTNEEKLLKCIRLYCENGAEVINSLKAENERLSKFFNAVKDYYGDFDSLAKRLQDDYGVGKPFEQMEEDRLGLCFVLDLIDEMSDDIQLLGSDAAQNRPHFIELKCKVGDAVYETDTNGAKIFCSTVKRIIIDGQHTIYETDGVSFDERAIGKTIFLTAEAVEARAKELQGKL